MNLLKRIFRKNEHTIFKRVIRRQGFNVNPKFGASHGDYKTFYSLIWILDDRIKLKVFAKNNAYSETEVIGPTLPSKKELLEFIKFNT